MKILVIGAGQMARGVIHDFLKQKDLQTLTVVDRSAAALQATTQHFSQNPKLIIKECRADDLSALSPLFREADGVISVVPYDFNLNLTKLAIEQACHFVDLGGNNDVVEAQFKLNAEAANAGIGVIPDCGLAPGMVSILAAHLIDDFARADRVRIRVGGLPVNPRPPLNYMLVFSVHGLINEYLEPALLLRDGKMATAPSLTEVEELEFPRPFGLMEAFITSGGTSTLPQTYAGKIDHLDYKTIRYPGHCHIMKAMLDMGFATDQPIDEQRPDFTARAAFETMLQRHLMQQGDDVVLIRVSVEGNKSGSRAFRRLQAIEYGDKKAGLTAMMRTTAFPAAIILQMLVRGQISDRGVLRQELAVPTWDFINELDNRDIRFESSE